MKRIVIGIVGLVLVGGAAALAQNAEPSYYPLKVGSKWTYRVGEQRMVLEVKRLDEVDGVKCAVLETRADNLIFSEHVAPAADGIYRYKAQDSKIVPPICFFKLPPQRGQTWEVDSTAGKLRVQGAFRMDEVEVAVPAGKFKTFVSKFDVKQEGQTVGISIHLAQGIGMVKQIMDISGQQVVVELEKYEEGK